MNSNQLQLNTQKTEAIIFGSRQQLSKLNIDHVNVGEPFIKGLFWMNNLHSLNMSTTSVSSGYKTALPKQFPSTGNLIMSPWYSLNYTAAGYP
jgi:hypothetical protein